MSAFPVLTQAAPPPPASPRPAAKSIEQQVSDAVQQSLAGAQAGQKAAEAAQKAAEAAVTSVLGGDGPGAKMAIDIIRTEIATEQANIKALTSQLVPGVSDARQEAITDQIDAAQSHLQSLQNQLEHALESQLPVTVPSTAPASPSDFPPQVEGISYAFFFTCGVVAIGVPLARAISRWMDRRGHVAPALPSLEPRFDRMEQAIEAIAIEVERVSEGQRYTNKLMGEMRALPLPNAVEQWPQGRKEGVPVERGRQG